MKILHVQQYFNENMGYQENILPYYQKKLGHDVIMITSTRSDGFNKDIRIKEDGEFIENGFKVRRINIKGEFKKRFVVFKDLYKHLENENPDYIYHHSVTSPSILTVSKYKKNHPNVFLAVDSHVDLNISGRNKLWKVAYYNLFWKKILAKVDKFIDVYFGVTPTRCLFLNEELGVNNEKIRLLPIGADEDRAKIKIKKEEFFDKYNIDPNDFIITHGGKITPEKQIDKIIAAFKRLQQKNVRLVLFGTIKDPKVEKLIKEDKRIIFIGWLNREDTITLLKHSDLGIWNTQHTTLLEDCIAVGLPLILRYYGSTCHLIKDNGMFLYEGSIREIQDKLNYLISNGEQLKAFKKNNEALLKLLSYNKIAEESIKYMYDLKPQAIHETFMNINHSDMDYNYFRKIQKN